MSAEQLSCGGCGCADMRLRGAPSHRGGYDTIAVVCQGCGSVTDLTTTRPVIRLEWGDKAPGVASTGLLAAMAWPNHPSVKDVTNALQATANTASVYADELVAMHKVLRLAGVDRGERALTTAMVERDYWLRLRSLVLELDHRNDYPENPDAVVMADGSIEGILHRLVRRAIKDPE